MRKDIDIKFYEDVYDAKKYRVLQNAVIKMGVCDATANQEVINNTPFVFSENIKTEEVTNQRQSGRCWIFASQNFLRHKIEKSLNIKNFELSQGYLFFYDKLEKSNYFLQAIIDTADKDIDDRLVRFLLVTPQQDGGQWDMIVSIIQKYGIVPKKAMPDTFNMQNSKMLNELLNKKLRIFAKELRDAFKNGKKEEELIELKNKQLKEVYAFLSVMLGTPVKEFDFEYYDADDNFHRDLALTPLSFYKKYVGIDLGEYISIINAPTKDKPYMCSFTVDYLGNVIDGREVKYLNLNMEDFKELAIKQLKDKETIWFGCDVGQFLDRKTGVLAMNTFEYENSFDMNFIQSKEDSLDYNESLMTHAMLLSGVNLDENGKSNRWKIENSWGEDSGEKGYLVMTDEWMDHYTYQIVIHKKHLSEEQLEAFNKKPIVLKPWDPMGSLARCI